MGKALKGMRFRNIKLKVLRRNVNGRVKVSYLTQRDHPQPSAQQTGLLNLSTHVPLEQVESDEPMPSCSSSSETAYSKAKKRELNAWDAVKEDMLQVSFEASAPDTSQCVLCQQHGDYRCLECSTTAVLCEACLRKTHKNSLHVPEKWNNTFYEPSYLGLHLYLPEGHDNHAIYAKDMKVIVNTGRLCTFHVEMCECEPEACTLLRYGLWPATAEKPQTAFSIPLLELFVCLSLECQVSVEGFCNTLRWRNYLSLTEVNALYRALVGESISHFRHHHFRQRSLVDICPQLDDGTTCPACPKAGLSLYVIDELLQRCTKKNIHLRVVYDIACVVASHLNKSGGGIPPNISLAVPAFHIYGHKLPCQIKYSTRRLNGFGLTDGEGMERLWSFLRRFARVTKEMTPSHRLDLLTDALLHYGRRKSTDLEVSLLQKLDKAEKLSSLAEEDISSVIREAPVLISEQNIERWKKRELEMSQQKPKPIHTVSKWKRTT